MKRFILLVLGLVLLIVLAGGYQLYENKDSLVATVGSNKSWELTRFLVQIGADPNAHGVRDMPPLHYAVQDGNMEMIDFLIENGADVNVKASFYGLDYGVELSPLVVAYVDRPDNLEVIKKLLSAGADPNELIPNSDSIISYQQYELLNELLSAGVEVEVLRDFATLYNDTEALKIIASHLDTQSESN